MVIARGAAGFGAGGEYPTCATSAVEAADEDARVQRMRGKIIAFSTIFAIDLIRSMVLYTLAASIDHGLRRATSSLVLSPSSCCSATTVRPLMVFGVSVMEWDSL